MFIILALNKKSVIPSRSVCVKSNAATYVIRLSLATFVHYSGCGLSWCCEVVIVEVTFESFALAPPTASRPNRRLCNPATCCLPSHTSRKSTFLNSWMSFAKFQTRRTSNSRRSDTPTSIKVRPVKLSPCFVLVHVWLSVVFVDAYLSVTFLSCVLL